jgi:hypothetical protein
MTAPTYSPDSTETNDQRGGEPIAVPAEDAGCPVCPHPLAAHDPIAARFCRATTARALHRGCACRG